MSVPRLHNRLVPVGYRMPQAPIVAAIGGVLMAALVMGSPRQAHAQAFELIELKAIKRKKEDKGNKKKKGPKKLSHVFRAVVKTELGNLSPDKFTLSEDHPDGPIMTKAERAVSYLKSDEPLALVVLIQGDERWMGNETYAPNPDDASPGAFTGVGASIDSLAKAGPPGSKAALLVYRGGKPETKYGWGPLSEFGATALGQQKDYEGIGVPLIPGLAEAGNMLSQMGGYRKVLVVMGDGTGQVENVGPQLKGPVKKLKDIQAESYSIYYSPMPSADNTGYAVMKKIGFSGTQKATSKDNFGPFGETIAKKIGARYYVYFPTMPFPMDGKNHDMLFKLDKEEEPREGVFQPKIKKPSKGGGGSLWWLWFIVLPLLIIVIIVIWLAKREPKAVPPPVMEEEPPPGPTPAQRTVMINLQAAGGGMPYVGWIVPLNGPNQYQTFKLYAPGNTKLGTGGEAHVVVDDTFMSTVHAEIVCNSTGFVLNDAGSTNGTFVNQKRVSNHELVDNDVFTLGKTDFKFKSIN